MLKMYYHKTATEWIIVELEDGSLVVHNGLTLEPINLEDCKPYKGHKQSLRPMWECVSKFYQSKGKES
jgi:hypothetical protein